MQRRATPERATVLLVEDDDDIRLLICQTLLSQQYKVLVAEDAAQAIMSCTVNAETIDVLVTDLGLPGVSGGELSRAVTRLRPTMGIVYVSGMPRDLAVSSGMISSNALFVGKPFTAATLTQAVRNALAKSAGRPGQAR